MSLPTMSLTTITAVLTAATGVAAFCVGVAVWSSVARDRQNPKVPGLREHTKAKMKVAALGLGFVVISLITL